MPVMLQNGNVLLTTGGNVAIDPACCCSTATACVGLDDMLCSHAPAHYNAVISGFNTSAELCDSTINSTRTINPGACNPPPDYGSPVATFPNICTADGDFIDLEVYLTCGGSGWLLFVAAVGESGIIRVGYDNSPNSVPPVFTNQYGYPIDQFITLPLTNNTGIANTPAPTITIHLVPL